MTEEEKRASRQSSGSLDVNAAQPKERGTLVMSPEDSDKKPPENNNTISTPGLQSNMHAKFSETFNPAEKQLPKQGPFDHINAEEQVLPWQEDTLYQMSFVPGGGRGKGPFAEFSLMALSQPKVQFGSTQEYVMALR